MKYGPIIINQGSNSHDTNHPINEGIIALNKVMLWVSLTPLVTVANSHNKDPNNK